MGSKHNVLDTPAFTMREIALAPKDPRRRPVGYYCHNALPRKLPPQPDILPRCHRNLWATISMGVGQAPPGGQ